MAEKSSKKKGLLIGCGSILAFLVVVGLLLGGCTALFVTGVDEEVQKQEKKEQVKNKEAKKPVEVGTTKVFEDVSVTVDSVEEIQAPEYTEKEGTFYKVSFTIKNDNDEDALFSSGDFKMQSEGKQFENEFGYPDSFDLDMVNSGNEVTGQSYFVDTKGTQEDPVVQLSFTPFFEKHKATWK